MRIPFDSVVLRAVVEELQPFVGGKLQRVVQPDDLTVTVELYGGPDHGLGSLLLSCHADLFRAHLVTRKHPKAEVMPAFGEALRSRLTGRHLTGVEQIKGDRVLILTFEDGHRLVAELMGKHSNLMLVDESKRVVAAAKWVGRSKSVRPIQPGQPYVSPPVLAAGGQSPFAQKLIAAGGAVSAAVHPVLSPGNGAYPYSVAALGMPEVGRKSISIALEQHFDAAAPALEAEALRKSLSGSLSRVLLSREAAVADLTLAVETGQGASKLQRAGELLLAFGPSTPFEGARMAAFDYDGAPVAIAVDPELGFKENAEAYFRKARRAKDRLSHTEDQLARLSRERDEIAGMFEAVSRAETLSELGALHERALARRWLHVQVHAERKEDRPYAGHRIRELVGPGGKRILFGESAEANDYLTLRVAKPNDIWLHVRGGTSAHVIIVTDNQPARLGPEALIYAAKVAVSHSPSKHAGIVAVDYTLKKYVRKSRGAPVGSAVYTHEKTLHVQAE